MMRPTIGTHMALTDLINRPSTLADTITTLEIKVFDDVEHAHSHPNAFISRLLQYNETDFIIFLREWLIDYCYGVSTCPFSPLSSPI